VFGMNSGDKKRSLLSAGRQNPYHPGRSTILREKGKNRDRPKRKKDKRKGGGIFDLGKGKEK